MAGDGFSRRASLRSRRCIRSEKLVLLALRSRSSACSALARAKASGILTPALQVLPAAQLAFMREEKRIPPNFVLYGGTALALRLGHRQSIDFDFFSSVAFTAQDLEAALPFARGAEILQTAPNTLVLRIDRGGPVTVSFFGALPFGQLAAPDRVDSAGMSVASLKDLMATKLKAVFRRSEAKDYIDIATIIRAGISLPEGLGGAIALFGPEFNPALSLKALTYYGDGDLQTVPEDLRVVLLEAVKSTDDLPVMELQASTIGAAP